MVVCIAMQCLYFFEIKFKTAYEDSIESRSFLTLISYFLILRQRSNSVFINSK